MKAGEMTDQQIVEILQEAQSGKISIVDLCQIVQHFFCNFAGVSRTSG
jgi:hypothetical protein